MPFGPNGFPKSGLKMTWVHGRCTTLHSNIDPKTRLKRVKHIPGQTHKHVFLCKNVKSVSEQPNCDIGRLCPSLGMLHLGHIPGGEEQSLVQTSTGRKLHP